MRLALIRDGVVVNVIEGDEDFRSEPGTRALLSAEAGPAWTFDGAAFSPPGEASAAPKSASMFQLREAMRRSPAPDGGALLDAVNDYVESRRLELPTLALAWEYATDVERDGDLMKALAKALNLDDAALDALFHMAACVSA